MIKFIKPKLPEFKGKIKTEKWGWWVKLSDFHDPIFIPKSGSEPNF